jgi:hypothetical protein
LQLVLVKLILEPELIIDFTLLYNSL